MNLFFVNALYMLVKLAYQMSAYHFLRNYPNCRTDYRKINLLVVTVYCVRTPKNNSSYYDRKRKEA